MLDVECMLSIEGFNALMLNHPSIAYVSTFLFRSSISSLSERIIGTRLRQSNLYEDNTYDCTVYSISPKRAQVSSAHKFVFWNVRAGIRVKIMLR